MADIDFNLIGKLEEKIETLTFRNKASFKIGKAKREKAYTMAIDIIVESVDYNLYENSKANPSLQFYGYCVLVFQDMTSIEIPIHFPRQRLYYAIQREAFRQWRGFVNYYEGYLLHQQTSITLGLLLAAFDIPPFELDSQLAKTQWIELPLREVYIKCQKNTQFKVEYSAWNPVAFVDPLTGQTNDGKSNQEDGEKDGGLPKDGIQPKRNSPSNPFSGNAPASSFEEMGLKGLDSIDPAFLSNPNPDNTYVDPFEPRVYSVTATGGFWNGTGTTNLFNQTATADSLGASVPPFRAVSTFQTNLNGNPNYPLYFVKIVDSENRQVNTSSCFNGVSCVRIGVFDGSVSWS